MRWLSWDDERSAQSEADHAARLMGACTAVVKLVNEKTTVTDEDGTWDRLTGQQHMDFSFVKRLKRACGCRLLLRTYQRVTGECWMDGMNVLRYVVEEAVRTFRTVEACPCDQHLKEGVWKGQSNEGS